jgi:hypothetical protein
MQHAGSLNAAPQDYATRPPEMRYSTQRVARAQRRQWCGTSTPAPKRSDARALPLGERRKYLFPKELEGFHSRIQRHAAKPVVGTKYVVAAAGLLLC